MNHTSKILAISSFPTIGDVGLKNMIPILGSEIIPVPTLILNGLGNMQDVQRYKVDFESILFGSFKMAVQENYRLIVYVGYLDCADQIPIITRALKVYKESIISVLIDPVCGDHGKIYVSQDIIDQMPNLLEFADWTIPNLTELEQLTGIPFSKGIEKAMYVMAERWNRINIIVTGIVEGDIVSNYLLLNGELFITEHTYQNGEQSGTGDLFAALFLYLHFLKNTSPLEAVNQSGEIISEWMIMGKVEKLNLKRYL